MPLLVVVGVGMAPIPIMGLLSFAGPRKFVVFPVIVGQIDSPGMILTIIPVVIILMVGIVNSNLDAAVVRSGGGHKCHG
jgi:hypothetical protein